MPSTSTGPVAQPATVDGLASTIKDSRFVTEVTEKLNVAAHPALHIVLYAGVGFLLGFLIKRYAQYVAFLILVLIFLFYLQQTGLIAYKVQWHSMAKFFNLPPVDSSKELFSLLTVWVRDHLLLFASLVIGVLLGVKCG